MRNYCLISNLLRLSYFGDYSHKRNVIDIKQILNNRESHTYIYIYIQYMLVQCNLCIITPMGRKQLLLLLLSSSLLLRCSLKNNCDDLLWKKIETFIVNKLIAVQRGALKRCNVCLTMT
jgi:hypothetical protein